MQRYPSGTDRQRDCWLLISWLLRLRSLHHTHTHTLTRATSRHTHAHWRVPARSEQCRRRPRPTTDPPPSRDNPRHIHRPRLITVIKQRLHSSPGRVVTTTPLLRPTDIHPIGSHPEVQRIGMKKLTKQFRYVIYRLATKITNLKTQQS